MNFQEILFLGIFHGTVFSLPFSAPLLICFRRFALDGLKMGTVALLGTLFGQLAFVSFIFLGVRPLIQCWYIFEPFLAFLGMSLALKLATDFFHQKNFGFEDGSAGRFSLGFSSSSFSLPFFKGDLPLVNFFNTFFKNQSLTKIFTFQFLLMFLNPAFPATSTRLILGQDFLDALGGPSNLLFGETTAKAFSGLQFGFFYSFGFVLGSLVLVTFFVFLVPVVFGQVQTLVGGTLGLRPAKVSVQGRILQTSVDPVFLNKAFVFLIIGCLLQGTVQYSWRLFTQYPIDFIGWKYSQETKSQTQPLSLQSGSLTKPLFPAIQREFPSFDSNIRHRDKNLAVERHIPVEKVNARRTLSGRPPLNEEQKSDAYVKYNSFFLNKIEQAFEDAKIHFRTPNSYQRTFEDITQLQKMKERYLKAQALFSGYKGTNQSIPSFFTKSRALENTTKGKPKFSYIRNLLAPKESSHSEELYTHDDLQIYQALFQISGAFNFKP